MHEIAIVGGSGFIGSSLANHLCDSYKVRILDVNPPKAIDARISFHPCDIRDYKGVERDLQGVEAVVHTAIVQIPRINEERRLGYEVNIQGIQNVCEAVDKNRTIKGLILTGSWHVFGEREFKGVIDEEFGFRPDRVDERARLYALCKIVQESIVRVYDEMSDKIYGVIRIGTVLGENMPEKTAANLFITKGLNGETLTPYKNSIHRPMLYVDINDVCKAFGKYIEKILGGELRKEGSFAHIVNLCWPKPVTIIELANMIRDSIRKCSKGKINPKIEIIDTGQPDLFSVKDKKLIKVDVSKAMNFFELKKLTNPKESIERIITNRSCKPRCSC